MSTAVISLQASSSIDISDLKLNFWFDGQQVSTMILTKQPQDFDYEFSDDKEAKHNFIIELYGKLPKHTEINDTGKIIKDVVVGIQNVALNRVMLGHKFNEKTSYFHNHNGTSDRVQQNFFGIMGCNGYVELQFSTPIHMWLLENM